MAEYFDQRAIEFLTNFYYENPARFLAELFLLICIGFLFVRPRFDPRASRPLNKREIDELIAEWRPDPLCPKKTKELDTKESELILQSHTGAEVTCNERKMINFASADFLGSAARKEVKELCKATIEKYGVGACGPRGFYGTIDVHLDLEKEIAKFFGAEEAIIYSDGIACISSVIPTYTKKNDLVICDEGVNFGIQQGVLLSRANVLYFKHNDLVDLKRILDEIKEKQAKSAYKMPLTRRFIVVEGVYQNYGDICPLKEVVALKNKYKYRLIVDDSYGLGVLGQNGKGTWEHSGVKASDIELLCGNMDTSMGTVGGFCVGDHDYLDRQRLHGLGYCFSASAPPYTAVAGISNLRFIDGKKAEKIRTNATTLRKYLESISGITVKGKLTNDELSPVIHIRVNESAFPGTSAEVIVKEVTAELLRGDVIAYVPQYVPGERNKPSPSIQLFVTVDHRDEHLKKVTELLSNAFRRYQRV